MGKIDCDKFIELCKKAKEGEISLEEIFKDIKIKKYIPFEAKLATCALLDFLLKAASDGDKEIQIEIAYREYEFNKLGLLLSHYTDIDFVFIYQKKEEYDLIKELEIDEYIKKQVGRDYEEFSQIIDKTSGINTLPLIYIIKETFNSLPTALDLQKATEGLNKFSSEDIENLTFLTKMNDPVTANIAKMIKTNPEEFKQELEEKNV